MNADQPKTADARQAHRQRPARKAPSKENPFYILAAAPRADVQSRVLKYGETFAVFDHFGDIKQAGLGDEGIYHEGTRYLSGLLLGLGSDRPLFLSSTVKEDNDPLTVDLTNPDVSVEGLVAIPRGTLHLFRAKFLGAGVCYERFRIRNYGLAPIHTSFFLRFQADFADIFEVRGTKRQRRGELLEAAIEDAAVVLAYRGLDQVVRRTRLEFCPPPTALDDTGVTFALVLPPQEEATYFATVFCEVGEAPPPRLSYDDAWAAAEEAMHRGQAQAGAMHTSNEQCNDWLNRSVADLHMMTTETAQGPYPYAGVPWFSTAFGRDGIIIALERLWLDPELARGVLGYLAATQAKEVVPVQDAEPGKILHETRRGEMAALGEIPFGRYYGSVDATPLFLMLAAAYYERTADRPFIETLWPHVEAALGWIDTFGDMDGDGFVEYFRHSPKGLVQQGWKDSHDSVFHADGTLARGPIALCEVQGYVYAAKRGAASLALALDQTDRAADLLRQAEALQQRFEQAFWSEELGTYALALDGDKRPCRVRTSNAGNCLFTGIASRDHALRTAETLLDDRFFSGWGIRTVACSEARYNPMSYHNGSIWPHDNALIAAGFGRYGLKEQVLRVLTGFLDASIFVDLHRLPELFCGFHRRPGEGPTLYPVACAPQAWSAATVFLLLQACLGLRIQALQGQIHFDYPLLPPSLKEVHVRNLRVGHAIVDLQFQRHGHDVSIHVLRRTGPVEIVMVK
jgi:glycogen debranching enzyme